MYKSLLTDPKNHNPKNFVYLVHGMSHFGSQGTLGYDSVKEKIGIIRAKGCFFNASLIAKLDESNSKEKLCTASKVERLATFANVGFIISPGSDENIYVARDIDLGSPTYNIKELAIFANREKGSIMAPVELLMSFPLYHERAVSYQLDYNHLILEGDEKTIICGVYTKERNWLFLNNGRRLQEMASEALQQEIPLIVLPKPNETRPDPKNIAKTYNFTMERHPLNASM